MLEDERTAVCETAKQMTRDGLVVGTSGNVSIRAGNYLVVTPTGVNYALMRPEDVTVVTLSGEHVEGALRATSELPLHLAACAAGATAVVHTHAVHATAVSTLVDAVPPVHYLLGLFGGSVRVAPYATYGTRALADGMLAAMAGRTGCLLANHGTVTTGVDLASAYDRALQLEWLCRVWLTARTAGDPSLLPSAEVARVALKLRSYGQPQSLRLPTVPSHTPHDERHIP